MMLNSSSSCPARWRRPRTRTRSSGRSRRTRRRCSRSAADRHGDRGDDDVGLSSWRNGCFSAASMSASDRPLARASISARSCRVTISWSRSAGDSSRQPKNAMTHTIKPAMPQMRYSWVQTGRRSRPREWWRCPPPPRSGCRPPGRWSRSPWPWPAHLGGEVADQCGGGHQARRPHEADHEGRDGERRLLVMAGITKSVTPR